MENVIVAVVVITLILLTAMTVFQSSLSAQDAIATAWQEMEERAGDRARTDLTPITATIKSAGSLVEITLRNDGDTKLADFDRWDVIFQYYTDLPGYETDWYPYVNSMPGNNQWTVAGIYVDAESAVPEVYEIGILNPEEEIVVQIQVWPVVGANTTNMVTVGTSNGVRTSTVITR